ncbi:hypothetical protein FXB40_32180 [Bradyrhizobium rifense]|uniref:Uncharacterized protein n=1 Tax=Bradyrhizobium rifense TaxID=515499 RepID=A0A5D3KIF4_9BRAD|nr:hypothetical protein [Bradyrhizobium rifense]TYL90746.1 hypothetical protein FXB40_32180 [Bradyrhizobium rifense]
MDVIKDHLSEIISFAAGLAGGSFLTFKFTRTTRVSDAGNLVNQSGATAGGDVVGRDKLAGRDQS